ncbi:hypothetical protein VdG1_07236 [Verticillium dahliae VDG1]|nr:hypothetical protein VdG1_07236 [Verticillium dahliae VDG1]
MDYVADCESEGNPTILAINIATTFQNIRAGSNLSVSVRWTPPYPPVNRMMMAAPHHRGHAIGPAGRSWLQRARDYLFSQGPASSSCSASSSHDNDGEKCQSHDDEHTRGLPRDTYWLPGNRIHASEWARLVVTSVYWVGGFGDRAYIGWLPVDDWHSITRDEWEAVELPGEREGWREWSVVSGDEEKAFAADL